MKSILMSIQPQHCENICTVIGEVDGKPIYKKQIEVRKTAPKEVPFKVYIYCTKPKRFIKGYADDDLFRHIDGRIECGFSYQLATEEGASFENNVLSGKVIGEFVVEKVYFWQDYWVQHENYIHICDLSRLSCVDGIDLTNYAAATKDFRIYALHISQLKIYDKPKELGEFRKQYKRDNEGFIKCGYALCPHVKENGHYKYDCVKECPDLKEKYKITRPPQSWMYVESLDD